MPAAEVDVTAELIEALLAEQHLDLADLAVVELAGCGWLRRTDHTSRRSSPRR